MTKTTPNQNTVWMRYGYGMAAVSLRFVFLKNFCKFGLWSANKQRFAFTNIRYPDK